MSFLDSSTQFLFSKLYRPKPFEEKTCAERKQQLFLFNKNRTNKILKIQFKTMMASLLLYSNTISNNSLLVKVYVLKNRKCVAAVAYQILNQLKERISAPYIKTSMESNNRFLYKTYCDTLNIIRWNAELTFNMSSRLG